jgi:hypothetical protein
MKKPNQELEPFGHLNELSSDLAEEGNQSSQHTEPKMVNKTLKVYKRKQKVAPKVVRRSVRLNNKKLAVCFKMKGSFWNIDGFKDPAKHIFVRETLSEHKLDFFAILETGRDNFPVPFLKNISAGLDIQWYCVPPIGRSGGILVGINAASLTVQEVVIGSRCVKFFVTSKLNNFKWVLVVAMGLLKMSKILNFLLN